MKQYPIKLHFSPSICAAPMSDYEQLIKKLLKAGIKMFHFDVMDASLTASAWINFQLLKLLPDEIFAEVHIMASDPIKFVKIIPHKPNTFIQTHLRMQKPFIKFIQEVKKYHFLPGLTFDLKDDIKSVDQSLLKEINWINFMSVKTIGLTNQVFQPQVIKKITEFKKLFPGWEGYISVDGSVREEYLPELSKLCNSIVVGNTILYKCPDYKKRIQELNTKFNKR